MSSERRVIAAVSVLNGKAVQSYSFNRYLPLGDPSIIVENLNRWGADEIILSDISFSKNNQSIDSVKLIEKVARNCFTPVTYGGGIRNLNDVHRIIRAGADKISINSSLTNFNFLKEIVYNFGSQALVISLDFKILPNGTLGIMLQNGQIPIQESTDELIQIFTEIGVGEYFLKFIDRDGMRTGFNYQFAKEFRKKVSGPVLLGSGACSIDSFIEAFSKSEVDGLVGGNMFAHFEHVIPLIKSKMSQEGIKLRPNEYYSSYAQAQLNHAGRLRKYDETYLEELMYLPRQKVEI